MKALVFGAGVKLKGFDCEIVSWAGDTHTGFLIGSQTLNIISIKDHTTLLFLLQERASNTKLQVSRRQ